MWSSADLLIALYPDNLLCRFCSMWQMHVVLSDLAMQLFVVLPKHLSLLLFSTKCDLQTDLSMRLASIFRTGMLQGRHTQQEQAICAYSDQSRRGKVRSTSKNWDLNSLLNMPGFTAITAATSPTASKTKPVSTPAGQALLCCSPTGKEAVRLGFREAGGFLTAVGFTCKCAACIGLLMQRLHGRCCGVEGGQLRLAINSFVLLGLFEPMLVDHARRKRTHGRSHLSAMQAVQRLPAPCSLQRLPQLILSGTCDSPEHSC